MPKRSLMLAGAGVKIAFQAGVLQVWLDEAGVEFDHGDAASAACFNLAMWVQGMSGTQIADNWRQFDPVAAVDVHWSQLVKLLYAESLFELDAFRHKIFPRWGLDFDRIRASGREATFNVYNFSKHFLRPVTPPEMTEDLLIATSSLPMWFPPVHIDGDTYIDAVFNGACNIEEAIRRGADELWIIWNTSQRGEWYDGFVGNFFGIFEATTNWNYKQALARIERNNAALARGEPGEFGRPITVRELKAEVPLHYLLNFSKDRANEAVNRGVEAARDWCEKNGVRYRRGADYATPASTTPVRLQFGEALHGRVGFGASDFHNGADPGRDESIRLDVRWQIDIDDVDRFLTTPEHAASLQGTIRCERLGGELTVRNGCFNLLVDSGDPTRKKAIYHAPLQDAQARPLTLYAFKDLQDDPGHDAAADTTTVYTLLLQGTVPIDDVDSAEVMARGILRIGTADFLKLLTTFHVDGGSFTGRSSALARFGLFYFGRLWDVYARKLLSSAPF